MGMDTEAVMAFLQHLSVLAKLAAFLLGMTLLLHVVAGAGGWLGLLALMLALGWLVGER